MAALEGNINSIQFLNNNSNVPATLTLGDMTANGGINIENFGALIVSGAISSATNSISLSTHSPLTVQSIASVSANIDVSLSAGDGSSSTDILTIEGYLNSTTGGVSLLADSLTVTGNVTAETGVDLQANTTDISGEILANNGSVNLNGEAIVEPTPEPAPEPTREPTPEPTPEPDFDEALEIIEETVKIIGDEVADVSLMLLDEVLVDNFIDELLGTDADKEEEKDRNNKEVDSVYSLNSVEGDEDAQPLAQCR